MGAEINKAIFSITTFYKSDDTKVRAKDLISELSTDERQLLLSIIDNTFDPSTTDCQGLTGKLMMISAKDQTDSFIPIAHEKDAELSSCGKTMMNIWRTIKDLFGTRISDAKLLKEINKFSKIAALEKMNPINTDLDDALLSQEPFNFYEAIVDLDKTKNYELDLTPIFLKDSLDTIVNRFIEKLTERNDDDLDKRYIIFTIASMIRKEILREGSGHFAPKREFSMRNLVEGIKNTGFMNLSLREQNMVRLFILLYQENLK